MFLGQSRVIIVLEPFVGQLFTLTCSLAFAVAWQSLAQHARSLCCALSATATDCYT